MHFAHNEFCMHFAQLCIYLLDKQGHFSVAFLLALISYNSIILKKLVALLA